MTQEMKARFDEEIHGHRVVIYMKGTEAAPQCGFSALAVEVLRPYGPLHTVDVLADPEVRSAIKEYSNWPTLPQVYINGKFVGGSDLVQELAERGELENLVGG